MERSIPGRLFTYESEPEKERIHQSDATDNLAHYGTGRAVGICSGESLMPTYGYVCTNPECGKEIELKHGMMETPEMTCFYCDRPLRRSYHPVGFSVETGPFWPSQLPENHPRRTEIVRESYSGVDIP